MGTNDKYNLSEAAGLFFTESREMLDEMESCLLKVEKDVTDEESINALFRSIHTIKGSSGMFAFEEIEKFTHKVENILDDARNGNVGIDSDLIGLMLQCHDYIDKLLNVFENEDGKLDDELIVTRDKLLSKLKDYIPDDSEKPLGDFTKELKDEKTSEADTSSQSDDKFYVKNECWHISLRLDKNVLRHGMDPRSFISFLGTKGNILRIKTIIDEEVDSIQSLDFEECFIGFEIVFEDKSGKVKKDDIEDAFEFLREDCKLNIIPPRSNISNYVELIDELSEAPMQIGEMLLEVGSLTSFELEKALSMQHAQLSDKGEDSGRKPIGEIMLEEKLVDQPVLDAALEKQNKNKTLEERKSKTIRIDSSKLDNLINLVGELVIAGANVRELSERSEDSDLIESVSTMTRLIEDIRGSAMNTRMVQIGDAFKRYERVVRDMTREKGKKINLEINGGDTELDKTIIEKISDPLMHLIRNSADHGIEMPAERVARGKSDTGTILLNAYHETGSIVIEVSDDGRGISKEKVLAKAIERGLVEPDKDLSDDEIYQFILQPGFSTAEEITNISGRGVGMDVVMKNIQFLRGVIDISSTEGEGTVMRIHLPLTLAIIDGFMVEVDKAKYVLPLDMVTECIEIDLTSTDEGEGGHYLNLRGDVLPYMRLRDFFNVESSDMEKENIIVIEYARKKVGLAVDKLIGEFQTVIKPLGNLFHSVKWIGGATILGTGEVAFILDIPMLIQHIQELESEKENVTRV